MKKYLYIILILTFADFTPLAFSQGKIAIVLPLSGAYAPIGEDARQGAEIAIEEINRSGQFEFIFLDSKTEPSFAITELNRAIDLEKIIGAYALRGPVGMALNPISKNRMIPFLGGIANKLLTIENPYAFQLWPNSEAEGSYIAESFRHLKAKKIAILTAEDDYTMAVTNALRSNSEDLEIVLDQQFTPAETDFRSTVLKLSKLKPDAILVNAAISQLAPLIRQIRQINIKSEIISNFWLGKKEVLTALGEQANNLYRIEQLTDYPGIKAKLGEKHSASGTTISGYVAVHMFNSALKIAGQQPLTSESLHKALLQVKSIDTPNGEFPVIDRKVQFPLALKRVSDTGIETVKQ